MKEIRRFERLRCRPEDALRTGRISGVEFERWRSLLHALEAYEEGEGIEVMLEEQFSSIRLLRKVLTERRLRLLEQIGLGASSITELANKTGPRDIKNVYDDLKILEGLGLVALERAGNKVVPRLLLSDIHIGFQ